MPGVAVLAIYDKKSETTSEIHVSWPGDDPDKDATVRVPVRYRTLWQAATKRIKQEARDVGTVAPYSNLPIEVDEAAVSKSATGAYAVAKILWPGIGWKVAPGYTLPAQDYIPAEAET